jgi:hypothetical protein
MFGFYISAIVIGYGVSTTNNQSILLEIIVPVLSLFVLLASCFYFNRLTVQHVFIRMFGHEFDRSASTKSADQLWSELKKTPPVTFFKSATNLFTSDYTGPYPYFFLMYNAVGLSSLLYSIHPTFKEGKYIISNIYVTEGIYILCAASFSIWLTALMTRRAWKAIAFEERKSV